MESRQLDWDLALVPDPSPLNSQVAGSTRGLLRYSPPKSVMQIKVDLLSLLLFLATEDPNLIWMQSRHARLPAPVLFVFLAHSS